MSAQAHSDESTGQPMQPHVDLPSYLYTGQSFCAPEGAALGELVLHVPTGGACRRGTLKAPAGPVGPEMCAGRF